MASVDLAQLKTLLTQNQARWQAGDAEPTEHALGYVPGPSEHSLAAREMLAFSNHQHFKATEGLAGAALYPPGIDWRSHNGSNYVTPVKDQQTCGCCVAFGSCATVEANERIQKKNANLAIDLSEANLFYCPVAGITQGHCSSGWYVDAAMNVFLKRGVVDEACFPYTPGDQPCKVCADWEKRVTKIKKWHKLTTVADMKSWLASYGPVVTCLSVYADFFAYHSGVYHHVTGALDGGHCVSCVGYNEVGRYWICKNSWNTGWGEAGFFRIAYGQVGIDATMWAPEV